MNKNKHLKNIQKIMKEASKMSKPYVPKGDAKSLKIKIPKHKAGEKTK